MEEEIRGFRELFDKFISEPGPSVEWENIQVSYDHHHGVHFQFYPHHDRHHVASLSSSSGVAPPFHPLPLKPDSNQFNNGGEGKPDKDDT